MLEDDDSSSPDSCAAQKELDGTSIALTLFVRFFPGCCFWRTLRLRWTSPPKHLAVTSLRSAAMSGAGDDLAAIAAWIEISKG